jgi:hypothetical protein
MKPVPGYPDVPLHKFIFSSKAREDYKRGINARFDAIEANEKAQKRLDDFTAKLLKEKNRPTP